jgi:hypothetical protein
MNYLRYTLFLCLALCFSLFSCQSEGETEQEQPTSPPSITVEKTPSSQPAAAPEVAAGEQETAEAFFDRILPILQNGTPDQLWEQFVNKEQLFQVALLQAPPKEKVISEMGGESAWEQYQTQVRQQVDFAWEAMLADKEKIFDSFRSIDWNAALVQNVQLRQNANQYFTSQTKDLDHLGIIVVNAADGGQISTLEIPCLRDESGKWLIVNPPQVK